VSGAIVVGGAGGAEPLRDPDSGRLIVFEGCLDNRGEVEGTLGRQGLPDAALVLAAFDRWEADVGTHLLGDFAFAVWDAPASRLVCVRDSMGQRPLFYSRSARCFLFGSEPQQIVRNPRFSRAMNEGVIAEYLTGAQTTIHETIWRDLRRLPGAHAVVTSTGASQVRRYWDFDPEARVRARSAAGYAEQFLDVFTEAVACRVRGARSVGVLLSGGVDSSSVAVVANALSGQGRCPPPRALSLVFPGRACDETRYIADVVGTIGLRSDRVDGSGRVSRTSLIEDVERSCDVPPYPNGVMLHPLRRLAADLELSVLLTGYGGDDWFTGSVLHAADLLAAGRIASALRQLRRDSGKRRDGPSLGELIRLTAASLLPPSVWRMARRLRGPVPNRWEWIRPELASRVRLPDRMRPASVPPFPTHAQRAIYRVATAAAQVVGDEMEDRAAHAFGVPQRHPFYDRRVAAFGLALPEVQRRNETTKVVIRRSLRNLLPTSVVSRTDKAEFTSVFVDVLESLGGLPLFARLRSEEAGWVDGPVVRRRAARMFELYRQGNGAYIPWTQGLWEVAGLELWLESVETGFHGTSCGVPDLTGARS
jgi:asparagine synthase (glutamine-hydrolysing)